MSPIPLFRCKTKSSLNSTNAIFGKRLKQTLHIHHCKCVGFWLFCIFLLEKPGRNFIFCPGHLGMCRLEMKDVFLAQTLLHTLTVSLICPLELAAHLISVQTRCCLFLQLLEMHELFWLSYAVTQTLYRVGRCRVGRCDFSFCLRQQPATAILCEAASVKKIVQQHGALYFCNKTW